MLHNKYVDAYIEKYKNGELVFNEKRIKLIKWLEKEILSRDDLYYFNEQLIEDYIAFAETWYFELDEWEKFIAPFVFLFRKSDDRVVFRIFILIIARGAGKNGFISTLAHFFISSLHGVEEYDAAIIANSEDQAKVSFEEIYNTIIKNHELSAINTRDTHFDEEPTGEFEPWKSNIKSRETNSKLKFYTANPDTKDGGRQAVLFFDEFHQFQTSELVKVFTGGQGKKPFSRQFFIGTKGFIREGYFDMMYKRSERILDGEVPFNGIFPFINEIDSIEEMDDEAMWEKANPALQKPLTPRAEELLQVMQDEYYDLYDEPSGRPAFVTKRMNFVEGDAEHDVASRKEIMSTNREMLEPGVIPIGGLDFASVRDFTAVGALFPEESGELVWRTHSYATKPFVDKYYGYSNSSGSSLGTEIRPPIKAWEQEGLMTVVDNHTIDPRYIVNWFLEAREKWGLTIIVIDNFQSRLIKHLLEDEGFIVITIFSMTKTENMLAPQIEDNFANNRFIFGENPLMRWFTNNVYVKETANGKIFEKKEKTRRKTDGFQALVHAMFGLESPDYKEQIESNNNVLFIDGINF